MAILMDNNYVKCKKCGSESFYKKEIFRIKTSNKKEKVFDVLKTKILCAECDEELKE